MTAAKDFPRFVRDMLASPPRAGEGVNLYLYRVARLLHPYRSECEIADILRAVTVGCGRVVTEKEIRRAVENSKAAAWVPGEPVQPVLQPTVADGQCRAAGGGYRRRWVGTGGLWEVLAGAL